MNNILRLSNQTNIDNVAFANKLNQKYMVDLTNFGPSKYSNGEHYSVDDVVRRISRIEEIIIHCTATDSEKWDDPEACIDYDLNPNHISKRGCPTATYHYLVNQTGDVHQLVSANIKTWNCSGHNQGSIAVCINHGGEYDDAIEQAQYDSLVDTICHVIDFMDWSHDESEVKDRLHFHRDFSNKLCPGVNLDKDNLITNVLLRLETWGDGA